MNAHHVNRFLRYAVVWLVLGIVLGMAGCSKKAIKAGSAAAVEVASSGKAPAMDSGPAQESKGSVSRSVEVVIDELEVGSPRGNAHRVGEELIVVQSGSMESARAQGGGSSLAGGHLLPGVGESPDERIFIEGASPERVDSKQAPSGEGPEHVPEPMIVVAAPPELIVPSPIRPAELHAPAVASAAVDTFVIQPGFEDIYFDFDRWAVPQGMQSRLSEHAQWLKENPGSAMFIEGYCDVRGSREYNMVLGEKRARSVRDFLVDLGIADHRLSLISFGKERLTCFENEESCHHDNRRAHLAVR